MAKLRVEGYGDLIRDTNSNAIVNSSTSEYKISEIIRNMKLIRKSKPVEDTAQILNERYNKWKLIVDTNKHISKNIMENKSA